MVFIALDCHLTNQLKLRYLKYVYDMGVFPKSELSCVQHTVGISVYKGHN